MMPLASSPAQGQRDWIAKTAVIMAISVTSNDSSALTPVPRRRAGALAPASAMQVVHGFDDRAEQQRAEHDRERPADDRAALQPQRQARAESHTGAGAEARPARSGTSPAPRSRRASTEHATASSTAVSSERCRPNGHHRFAPHGCISWPHPIGETQVSRAVAEVADHPQHVEDAEHDRAERVGAARGRGHLPGDGADADGARARRRSPTRRRLSEPVIPAPSGRVRPAADAMATPSPTATHSAAVTSHDATE